MKYLLTLAVLLVASTASAGQYHARNRVANFYSQPTVRTYVRAESWYTNPYFTPNPHYLPPAIGYSEDIKNPFVKPEAKMGQRPKPLFDIVTPGTYKRVKPNADSDLD